MSIHEDSFVHSFPAIRGVQAGKEYYVSMWPLGLLVKLLNGENDEVPPELNAQRTLNKSRIPEIANYIVSNRSSYGFSSITASVDGQIKFKAYEEEGIGRSLGSVQIPMDAKFIINDGQHRRAAIEKALEECPDLSHETISVVLFVDEGLIRSQQLFADLNRYAVRPTRSLNILYDHRNPTSRLAKEISESVDAFQGMTETAKTTISNRSRKLFTLSGIYQATIKLLGKSKDSKVTKKETQLAIRFWSSVARQIPQWGLAKRGEISSHELRNDFIHAHGIALQAIANCGVDLLEKHPRDWPKKLDGLKKIDWRRSSAAVWEGRALTGGRLNKSSNNVALTSNLIKQSLGVPLNEADQKVETLFLKGNT
ncbi:MAG TPA: DNA sulfur modification protein DndB [Opitutae bacterium]|nr:DNA sulfur modification protein DndB [Opitutae bacterium]